jgi:hypothetical protein
VQRAFLAAGDGRADEVQVSLAEGGFAAAGVVEVGVAVSRGGDAGSVRPGRYATCWEGSGI